MVSGEPQPRVLPVLSTPHPAFPSLLRALCAVSDVSVLHSSFGAPRRPQPEWPQCLGTAWDWVTDEAKMDPSLHTILGGSHWTRPKQIPLCPHTVSLSKTPFEGGGSGRHGTQPQPLGIQSPFSSLPKVLQEPAMGTSGCASAPGLLLSLGVF